jgi:hypothetical protein
MDIIFKKIPGKLNTKVKSVYSYNYLIPLIDFKPFDIVALIEGEISLDFTSVVVVRISILDTMSFN